MGRLGRVFWLTGLSGSGKTTLGRALQKQLPGSILLDGDELRQVMNAGSSAFDRESRLALAYTYGRLCGLLSGQGHTVIIATISLFHEVHAWNREHLPGYMEIFLDVPEPVRRLRDPKGLYAAQQKGEMPQMAGSGVDVELPERPHLRLEHTVAVDDAVRLVLQHCGEIQRGEDATG